MLWPICRWTTTFTLCIKSGRTSSSFGAKQQLLQWKEATSTAQKYNEAHGSARPFSKGGTVNKERGDQNSRYRADRHETRIGIRFTAKKPSMQPKKCLVGLQLCPAWCTERLQKNDEAQRLRIKHDWGLVCATTTPRVHNEYNVQEDDSRGGTVSTHIRNDVKPYPPTTL